MEEEEEARTAVYAATEIAADKIEAEDITNMARAAQLRKDYSMLLAPACLTTVRSWPHTKQEHYGINLFNALARITAKI